MSLLAFGSPGPLELGILLIFGLLIFGKRLPEVGKSIGQTVVQFKKGLSEATEEIHKPTVTTVEQPKIETTTVADASTFKFDPHTGKPLNQA